MRIFTLDSLKRLIYYIERSSRYFTAADKENLGVNIYFASYPKSMGMMKHGYDYTDRHTVVFIPSVFDNTNNIGKIFDLNASLNKTDTLHPTYIDSAFLANPAITTIAVGGALFRTTGSTSSGNGMNSQNHGTAVPPPPTGDPLLQATDPR